MDPPFFHSAMGPKNLKKFRHIQFSTPDSPVFAEFKYSLPFWRYCMLKFGFFQIFQILGCLWHRFLSKCYLYKKKILTKVCSAIPQYQSIRNLHSVLDWPSYSQSSEV
jgi:hypothetical protein